MPPPQKLPALTGLRFFACAMILLHHMRGSFGLPNFNGWLFEQGVSLFFVLSGFVLVYAYPALPDWKARRSFLVARFARLWPAYIFSIGLVLLLLPVHLDFGAEGIWRVVANLLLIHAWVPNAPSINGPSWSISTEFGFYLSFLWLIIDFKRTWWWKWPLTLVLALVAIQMTNSFGEVMRWPLMMNPVPRLFEFVCGMVAALAWRNLARIENSYLASAFEIAALLLFSTTSVWFGWIWLNSKWLRSFGATIWFGSGGSCAIPAMLLILALAGGRGAVSRLLSLRPIVILGEASYSIYLLHLTVLYVIRDRLVNHVPDIVALAAYLATTVALAMLVWLIIESPSRRIIIRGRSISRSELPVSAPTP